MNSTHIDTVCNVRKSNTKSSRIRSRAWFFTWNNPPKDAVTQITLFFSEEYAAKWVMQKEKGENGTVHYQGCVHFENARGIEFQSLLSNKIHWEKCRSWRAAVKYCTKVESRIEDPYSNFEIKYRKTLKDPLQGKEYYWWQEEILNIIDEEEPDDRTVHWYWESVGCSGKSSFCKHIRMKYGKRVTMVLGATKDILYALKTTLEENDVNVLIIDIPRCMDTYKVSYKAIECIKNGYFFSGKYESSSVLFNPPHVFCFSNALPDQNALSNDRWRIVEIL